MNLVIYILISYLIGLAVGYVFARTSFSRPYVTGIEFDGGNLSLPVVEIIPGTEWVGMTVTHCRFQENASTGFPARGIMGSEGGG